MFINAEIQPKSTTLTLQAQIVDLNEIKMTSQLKKSKQTSANHNPLFTTESQVSSDRLTDSGEKQSLTGAGRKGRVRPSASIVLTPSWAHF